MTKFKLIMVIVFEFEDSSSGTSITWTERREHLFETKDQARRDFIHLRNRFRKDNPAVKTAFAIYEMVSV